MKKIVMVTLVAAMLTTMSAGLTGCSGSQKAGGTIKMVMVGDKPAALDAVLEKANEIIEPEIGKKLEMEYIDVASFGQKSKMKMASNEKFDIMFTGYVNDYQTAVSLGGLMDITEYIDDIQMSDGEVAKMSDVVEEYFLESAMVEGKIYGIPNMQVVSNPLCYQMEKKIADECGVDYVGLQETALSIKDLEGSKKYMDMLTNELAKVKAKRPDLYTINPQTVPSFGNLYEDIISYIGIRKDGTSNEIVYIMDTEEFKYGVDKVREWYEKGYIRSDIASKGNSITSTAEKEQYAVMQQTWKPGQNTMFKNERGDEPVYFFSQAPYVNRASALATMLSVGANCRDPKAAVKLIYMINSNKELYNLLVWGIEGVHYTANDDGTAQEIPDSGYNNIATNAWRYGNQFNAYVINGQPLDVWEQTKEMNNNAKKSPAMGFVPKTDSITTEIANITNINSEYKAKIEFGTAPRSEYWDEYMSKLNAAGLEKVIEELQSQYDEFLANKN